MRTLVRIHRILIVIWLAIGIPRPGIAQDWIYSPRVKVTAGTKLDWPYALLGVSPAELPDNLLKSYSWKGQRYELYGPRRGTDQLLPLVIFVSPGDRPSGWDFWAPVCQSRGVLFAGVRDAGNGRSFAERIRATLEVLGDVRRRYPVDCDRTYICGYSGGGHVAYTTAFQLPEYFAGIVCVGAAPSMPSKPCLVDSAAERLSVATICGEEEPASLSATLLSQAAYDAAAIRSHTHVVPKQGHEMPPPNVFTSVFDWLDEERAARRELARKYPSTRLADAPTREEWARRSLQDACDRLQSPEGIPVALHQLQGIVQRWSDLPVAAEAEELLNEHQSRDNRPWEAVWQDRDRKRQMARAAGMEQLALSPSRFVPKPHQAVFAANALRLWQQVREDHPNQPSISQDRMDALQALAEAGSADQQGASPVESLAD